MRGDWLFPATILGRFKILLAILRQLHLIFAITFGGELTRLRPTAFFVDQLSAGIPVLRWKWPQVRILFYCHFPDLLLVTGREKWWRKIWRLAFDSLEGWTIRGADRVVVNSGFTKGVVERVWPGLGGQTGVGIVYPCVEVKEVPRNRLADGEPTDHDTNTTIENSSSDKQPWEGKKIVLSINRFERKKDVGLAIRAFAGLLQNERQGVRLVIAGSSSIQRLLVCHTLTNKGGYDNRIEENVNYHSELAQLAESLGLSSATTKNVVTALNIPEDIEILFLLSIPAQMKSMLLKASTLLVYTPSNEHFGIVPLEAMFAGVPVLAANSGGPLETIKDGRTGWLRSVDRVEQWTEVMQQALFSLSADQLRNMGAAGKKRVLQEFSETKMATRLDEEVDTMVGSPRQPATEIQDVLLGLGIFGAIVVAVAALAFRLRLL